MALALAADKIRADEYGNPFIEEPCIPRLVWVKVPRGDGGFIGGFIQICETEQIEPEKNETD